MAAVQGPQIATHPSPFRKGPTAQHRSRIAFQPPSGPPPQPVPSHVHSTSKADPFYGHEYIARLCGRFITHLFACPEYPPTSTHSNAKLPYFIAYALHRTKLHSSVTFSSLVLLQRLKARFPTARGSSGHRLFISAFMIASKVICDDTYSNKSWTIVAQGMFTLREINQMEREMCNYLEWELTVDGAILTNFEMMVKRDFRGSGPYPTYSLQMVSKKPQTQAQAQSASAKPSLLTTTSTSPIPAFTPGSKPSIAAAPAKTRKPAAPTPAPVSSIHVPPPPYEAPSAPSTPDTPSSCSTSSASSSPASSASPPTPPGDVDTSAQIASFDDRHALTIRKEKMNPHPLKGKMFAFAVPATW